MCMILANLYRYLSSSEKSLKNSGLNGDSSNDLCEVGAVLYHLSYQTNWELVVLWVNNKSVDEGYGSMY